MASVESDIEHRIQTSVPAEAEDPSCSLCSNNSNPLVAETKGGWITEGRTVIEFSEHRGSESNNKYLNLLTK